MTLPKNGTAWPPVSEQTEKLAEWSAWYSGDPTELSTFYGPRNGAPVNPAQFRGGVVGRLARWWWGVPTPAGEQSAKLHVPLAADICGTSADLLFSEPVALTSDNEKVSGFFADLQEDGLGAVLHESAETGAAMSGVYLRTVWDTTVSPRPWTEAAQPDGAIPTFRGGRLVAVTLWSELPGSTASQAFRLLEHHQPGSIEYGLFEGTGTNLGKRIPLAEHPDATEGARLASLVNEDGVQATGLTRLAVVYWPNIRPNRLRRNSPEGRSDLQGVEQWLDALDEAYSSWWRDIRHAKSRIHMPAQMLESVGPGQGAVADTDRELYVPLEGVLVSKDRTLSDSIDVQQFKIRVEEHRATCEFWTDKIIESAGYSTQSLSGEGDKTATEVRAHQSRSMMTRGKKVRYATKALREHLAVQLEVASKLGVGVPADADFKVEFSDGVQESALVLAQTAQALRNAEAASAKTRVQMLHPDWDEKAVNDEVAAILAETSGGGPLPVPDAGL